jgi:hypothetical protein
MQPMKTTIIALAATLVAGAALFGAVAPASAQSVGYVTGIPGPDPASGGDGLGWGPMYRPETSFAQPGTPPTPGQLAAEGYYRRTGRPVYPPVGYYDPAAVGAVNQGYYEGPRRVYRSHRIVRGPAYHSRRAAKHRRVAVRSHRRAY